MSGEQLVSEAIDALNAGDVPAFMAVVHPKAQVHTRRGVRRGAAEVEAWMRKPLDSVVRNLVIEDVVEQGDSVLAQVAVEFLWKEDGRLAESSQGAVVARIEAGRIAEWELFHDLAAARVAAGMR